MDPIIVDSAKLAGNATANHLGATTEQVRTILELVKEMKRGRDKFGAYNSRHEAWAVIREEVDELWSEVKSKDRGENADAAEALQVAATALRYVLEFSEK